MQQLEEIRDRVTISLYGTQEFIDNSYETAKNELENINNINKKFAQAARHAKRPPPEIVISILIIPDWVKKYNFTSPDYLRITQEFFEKLRAYFVQKFKCENDEKVTIENFYTDAKLDAVERGYLEELVAKGSNADMIKTHAIICDDNKNRRHLQMDSNTRIFDFQLLYNETFGSQIQQDALNASYYDRKNKYVSAHNKIVYKAIYTPVQSLLASTLKTVHLQYCREHKDDHINTDDPIKVAEKKEKNSIYSKDFVVALEKIGLTQRKIINVETDTPKEVYLAVMDKPEYRITKCVATAVNMSWGKKNEVASKEALEEEAALKALPSVQVKDASCDYSCFANAALKHTGLLTTHSADPFDDTHAHNQLLAISNQTLEREMIKMFIERVKEENFHLLPRVIGTLHIDTPRGKEFFLDLFGCSPDDYEKESLTKKFRK